MKKTWSLFAVCAAALILSTSVMGCMNMKIEEYKNAKLEFIPEDYFATPRIAYGQVTDRFGRARVSFTTKMRGEWNAGTQTLFLYEDFVFSDGLKMKRVWTLKKQDAHTYIASANDIPGDYIVKRYGNALHFNYAYPMPYGDNGKTLATRYDDWMWLQPDGETILNRSHITKFGFELAEVIASFGPDKK